MAAVLALTLLACDRDAAVRDTPSGPSFEFAPSAVYVLDVDMSADAYYTATSTWTIDKTASPSSHDRYAGVSFTSDYVVTLEETVTESEFYVSGFLTLTNNNDYDVDFDIGGVESVSCPGYTVFANGGAGLLPVLAIADREDRWLGHGDHHRTGLPGRAVRNQALRGLHLL